MKQRWNSRNLGIRKRLAGARIVQMLRKERHVAFGFSLPSGENSFSETKIAVAALKDIKSRNLEEKYAEYDLSDLHAGKVIKVSKKNK